MYILKELSLALGVEGGTVYGYKPSGIEGGIVEITSPRVEGGIVECTSSLG